MPIGGISRLKALKCLNPLRSPSLQLREAAQMLFYHPLHGEVLMGYQSFVTSKWSFQPGGKGSLWRKSLYLGVQPAVSTSGSFSPFHLHSLVAPN